MTKKGHFASVSTGKYFLVPAKKALT